MLSVKHSNVVQSSLSSAQPSSHLHLHYLKQQGISLSSSLLIFPFTLFFALLAFRRFPQSFLSHLLYSSPLLASSCLLIHTSHPLFRVLVFVPSGPNPSSLPSTLHTSRPPSSPSCHPFLSSLSYLSHPFSSPPPPPAVTPPLSNPVHPLMIAEHISFDTKTKGWVHMWFLCKSHVIWNINAGIIWLPGWGGGGGGGGFIITSDSRFLPPKDGEAVRMDWGTVKITTAECLLLAATVAYFCLSV